MRYPNYSYEIWTIRAKELFDIVRSENAGGYRNSYVRRENAFDEKLLAKAGSVNEHLDNAMFYQLVCSLTSAELSVSDARKDSQILRKVLVEIDFTGIFNNRSDYIEDAKTLFEAGIYLVIDNTIVKFIPFDKSNSMARNGRMYFICDKQYDVVNDRIMLGMNFEKAGLSLNLSKYYAYRGLYLSTGIRIDPKRIKLNEETVIVIPDINLERNEGENETVITAKTNNEKGIIEYEMIREKLGKRDQDRFDGEGLICDEYAKKLSKAISGDVDEVCSFQIRMPFAKGMLHRLSFDTFIKDHLKPEIPYEDVYIVDAFGIERNLSKAKIIIPVSMFKCAKWLHKYFKGKREDPLAYYYNMMQKYDHSIYVTNDDGFMNESGFTTINYQFLNTLKVNKNNDEIKHLLSQHYQQIDNSIDSIIKTAIIVDDNNEDNFGYDEKSHERKTAVWEKAIQRNPYLIKDRFIKNALKGKREGLMNGTLRGHLLVPGEMRYLSRDLFAFVLYLCAKTECKGRNAIFDNSLLNNKFKRMVNKALKKNQIIMPGSDLKGECVLLRNPHLSRNEERIAEIVPITINGFYEEYCNHLSGIVMVGYDATIPEALGGADFDGDIVKIVKDDVYVEAVKSGYEEHEGKRLPLPIVKIPSVTNENKEKVIKRQVDFDTIKNTFNNSIGTISNMAIEFGMREYSDDHNEEMISKCAECCIVVGLEIDACKNGAHPDQTHIYAGRVQYGIKKNGYYLNLIRRIPEEQKKYKESAAYKRHAIPWYNKTYLIGRGNQKRYIFAPYTKADAIQNGNIQQGEIRFTVYEKPSIPGAINLLPWIYVERITADKKKWSLDEFGLNKHHVNPMKLDRCIAEEKLRANLLAILHAYSGAVELTSQTIRDDINREGDNYIRKCDEILSLKYGNSEIKAKYCLKSCKDSEMRILDILKQAYIEIERDLRKAKSPLEYCEYVLDEIISKWMFLQQNRRELFIKSLGINLSKSTKELLTDYKVYGYKLFFYIVKSAWNELRHERDIDNMRQHAINRQIEIGNLEGAYWNQFIRVARAGCEAKKSIVQIKKELKELFKASIEALRESVVQNGSWTMNDIVQQAYSVCEHDNELSTRLFWELFSWKQIKENITPYGE